MSGCKCKHIYAVQFAKRRDPRAVKSIDTREPAPAGRKTYPQDWRAYNAAQTGEKAKFLDLLDDLCSGVAEPERQKNGRPPLPIHDALFAACYKIYSTVSVAAS